MEITAKRNRKAVEKPSWQVCLKLNTSEGQTWLGFFQSAFVVKSNLKKELLNNQCKTDKSDTY